MSPPALTRRCVEAARAGPKDWFLWDGEVAGFGVKVTPAGRKIYVLQYRAAGRTLRLTLGRHGAPWTLTLARETARARLAALVRGRELLPKRRASTLDALLDRYLEDGVPRRSPTRPGQIAGLLRNHVRPTLGARLAAEITPADIDRLMLAVAKGETRGRGGEASANAVCEALGAAFGFGMRKGLCDHNPAAGARRYRRRPAHRFLGAADYGRLGAVLDLAEATRAPCASGIAAIRLMLLTGLRPGEALALRASDVDFEAGLLHVETALRGRRARPIGAEAADLLGALPVASEDAVLFPGAGGGPMARQGLQALWRGLSVQAGIGHIRLLDLRFSYGALAAQAGFSLRLVGAVMGDLDPLTTARYGEFAAPEVKAAAARVSGEIARLLDAPVPAEAPHPSPPGVSDAGRAFVAAVQAVTWLRPREVAARSGLTVTTLAQYRSTGIGPAYRKIGARVVYDEADVEAWIEAGPRRRRRRRR